MGDVDMAAWLTEEAQSHLDDFGHFGLYEFLWTLHGADVDLPSTRAREIARAVAARLVTHSTQLRRMRWPHDIIGPPLPVSVLDQDDSWRVGVEFVALVIDASAASE